METASTLRQYMAFHDMRAIGLMVARAHGGISQAESMDAGRSRLVPELDVSHLETSLAFYGAVLGFAVLYSRPEERFAYLDLDGANLMIEEAVGPGRRFRTAPLAYPFGRGVNFQIEVTHVDSMLERIVAAGYAPLIPMEEQWYKTDRGLVGNRQFVVADPDGYLLRFFQGVRARND